jgi:serine/threonine protein kinase
MSRQWWDKSSGKNDESGITMNAREDAGAVANSSWLAGRYQIAELRARGALSLVYLGQDAVLQRPVAIIAPFAEYAGEYLATLELTATLAHPAFLALYDVVEQDSRLFLITEFVDGRPLADYIANGLPLRRALELAIQISRALAYAHARNVTHGDLTPAAIIVDRTAVARVTNLGLPPDGEYFDSVVASAFHSGVADDPETTATGLVEADPARFDVWAVAALLWLLITDAAPASTADDAEPPRVYRADTSPSLCVVIERALRVSHAQPIVMAEALATELATQQRDLTVSASDETTALPERLGVLRARSVTLQGEPSAGRAGVRANDHNDQRARAAAITTYDNRDVDAPPDDPHQTNPSDDRARNGVYAGGNSGAEVYAAHAPRLTLPARSPQPWSTRAEPTVQDHLTRVAVDRSTPGGGLGPAIWALIALAVFALCFAAGFFLAPALSLFYLP